VDDSRAALTKPPQQSRRGSFAARRLALLFTLVGIALVAWAASGAVRGARDDPPPPPVAPPPPKLKIVFPEGFTRAQMAERITAVNGIARRRRSLSPRLSAKAYLHATATSRLPGRFAEDGKRRSLEGFLFPATYEFQPKTTSAQLVRRQLEAFRRNWRKVSLSYARSKNLTPYDVLTIASMIEEEVVAAEERRLVAAVIYNRLKARMPLGIDATIRYALKVPPTQSLRLSQLRNPNPYNTRVHLGLPPTPIANPGLASIKAAARPARVDYLYFVRKPDKVHHFFTASERAFFRYQRTRGR
jgi:UPF0755 protein